MSWYAVGSLDDAFDATKALLTPLDAGQWLRLALVVFFLGTVGGSGSSAGAGGSTGGPSLTLPDGWSIAPPDGLDVSPPDGPPPGDFPFAVEELVPILLGALAVMVLLGVLYALVGSVMEFVFVESLRRRHVRIREYADQHWNHALRLFAFRVLLGLVVVVPVGALVLAILSLVGGDPQVSVGLIAVFAPLLVVVGLLAALVDLFTTNFVVPVMICENLGVLAAWRRFWPTMEDEWEQYGIYVLVRFVLALAVGVLASIIGGIVGAVLLAPVAVLGFLAFPAVSSLGALLSSPVALAIIVVVGLAYLVVLTAAVAVAFVPVQTYLRYHALLVLGDSDQTFDLIPELRREIRGEG